MNATQHRPGTALIVFDGLIPSETAKLRRHILKLGGQKIHGNTYSATCQDVKNLGKLKDQILERGTKETTVRLYYLTAKQYDASVIAHGVAT